MHSVASGVQCPECHRSPSNAEKHQDLPGCIDPSGAEAVCNECAYPEECCDDCIFSCGPDCDFPIDCNELDHKIDDTYCFEDSHSELFSDQMVQTFGFGKSLPQLSIEKTVTASSDLDKKLVDTALSTSLGHCMNQS